MERPPRDTQNARRGAASALAFIAVALVFALGATAAVAAPVSGAKALAAHPQNSYAAVCGSVKPHFARCDADVVTQPTGTPFVSSTPAGYGPSDLLSAYALASAAASSGSGETVAIVDAFDDPNAEADLGVYRSEYELSACTTANGCFRKVNQTGGTTYPTGNTGWGGEISLDLDMVSAICPKCHILLVEATSNSFADLSTAVDEAATLGATEISNSYGGSEYSGENSDSTYNHPGIAITASSGDNGYGVEYPAASQYVTAVGGTSLTTASNARGWTETAWSGAGSGCSVYDTKPSWQKDTGCTRRTVADVSADADPNTGVAVYDTYGESGWLVFGGTSVASPIIASYYALIGPAAATNYGSWAYSHTSMFNDVTSGSNGSCSPSPSYLCTAGVGYDGPTGIGTPEGVPIAPTVTTGSSSGVGTTTATVAGTVNPNGQSTTYQFDYGTSTSYGSQSPLPPDPSAGSGTTTQNESASLTGLTPGKLYHYRIEATNATGTTFGSDGMFTTTSAGVAPSVTTGSSSGVGTTTATVAGTVNPNGQSTTYQFDYGTSMSYGSQSPLPPDPSAGSGTTSQNESANLTGLTPGQMYHYRLEATNATGTTYGADQTFTTANGVTVSQAPQGTWVGTYGGSGYDLAAWSGGSDVTSMPGVSVSLLQGSRYVWASGTSDVRALENAAGTSRTAATYYDPSQVRVQLTFSSAYSGNLELYAVDLDSAGRTETITAAGQTANLSNFSQGAWVTIPIAQAANSTLTITVNNTGPANAVLSGILLGGGGTPPPPPVQVQGSWVGTYGGSGYDLAAWNGGSDVVSIPGVSVSLVQGSRYVWAGSTTDSRALENTAGTARTAATYYDPSQVRVQLTFTSAYSGNLDLYAVDWDNVGRTETITVGGQTANLSNFSQGAWVTIPIAQAANSTLTITVNNTGPANAVLSGILLGGGGTPPAWPGTGPTPTQSPQGNWAGTYGNSGYDLAAWNNGTDVTSLSGVSVNVGSASRYVWASGTSDVRALENASGTSRTASCYYDGSQVQVQLTFTSAYSGNLELYAVDWDSQGRSETVTVGSQSTTLSNFTQGDWLTFPVTVNAGGTVTITVTRDTGANAVLSGIFLN